MRIIIIGAGEVGQMVAEKLYSPTNDVVLIDSSVEGIERLRERFDMLLLTGDATNVQVMKRGGVQNADFLIAVSGDAASNMLACQIGHHFAVMKTICRLYSLDGFSEEDGVTPWFFGIDKAFSSPVECRRHVMSVLRRQCVLAQVDFSNPQASVVTIRVTHDSPLRDMRLQDIPDAEMRSHIRVAAMVRGDELQFPRGNTMLHERDRIYVAGQRDAIEKFIEYASGGVDSKTKVVVIAGASLLGRMVAQEAHALGMDVRVIEIDKRRGEQCQSEMPIGVRVVNGSATDVETLREAGADVCDTFVCTLKDDEDNILSCIIAKRNGAQKVVAVTHKPEYLDIVPAMEALDCGVNTTEVSANTVLRLMDIGNYRVDSLLQAYGAYFGEFRIDASSHLVGTQVKDCHFPQSAVLALLFRNGEVLVPTGNTAFAAGDIVVAIVTSETEDQLKRYFA